MKSNSRIYYKRFYQLVALAVAVMTAVLTGSLVLGDSVRWSLVERVNERLGNAETLIQTGTGFLNDSILNNHLLSNAKGYLLVEGFVSSKGQMIPVNVWGTDGDSLKQGEAIINEELRKKDEESILVLHLPSNNLVSSGSLFISQSYATQLRLAVKGVKSGQDGGNLLLHNEQVHPLNVFMNRQELAEALGVEGKVNVILSPDLISEEQFNGVWQPEYSGLTLSSPLSSLNTQHSTLNSLVIGTDHVFLPQAVVDSLKPSARYLAYFVNSLGDIPYSFVTATDQLQGDETILTDYAARRMDVLVGDSITMEYYVSHGGLKHLETRSHRFVVSHIVPVSEFLSQEELITADFPGLSGVKNCTDWDSDLPIDMSRITKADEDYWTDYRQLPKVLVSLDAVGKDWIGPYGSATKVVVDGRPTLQASLFGIAVVQPRTAALVAAQNGTDFGLLFIALGFFIIIAAILLMQNPLSEMYQLRRSEIQLLGILGFSRCQVFGRLFSEALPVVLLSSLLGVLLGYAYAATILWLLAGPWSGATHTDGFALHANAVTVILSLVVSVVLALLVLCLAVSSGIKEPKATRQRPSKSANVPSIASSKPVISFSTLHFSFLKYYRRQHRLSFWTLALGVLIVFAVGLNRPDFSHSSESATGGYKYFAESRIPLQYDLNTAAGRDHLHLGDLPADTRFLQMPKHTEDEASCLNLNRVETPSVLGMSLEDMSGFGIDTSRLSSVISHLTPVAVDEEALLWSMLKQVGDTLTYHTSDGQAVKAVIAATYPTGILHGNAIMPLEHFRQLWPDEAGSRILLMAGGDSQTTSLLTSMLSDYGVTITTTTDRLRMFFEVTDTYLRIFLSLGGLGLLLGLVSLLVVIRKNLTARRDEIRLYHTLGFSTQSIVTLLRREQIIVPLLAIFAGSLACLLLSLLLPFTSHLTPLTSNPSPLILFLLIILFTWIIIHISINPKTIKQCENYSS